MLVSLISYIDRSTLAVLSPTILAETGLSTERYGYIVSQRSLGRDVEANLIEVRGVTVNVVRTASGRLSYEDVLDELAEQPAEESKPLSPDMIERLSRMVLSEVALRETAVRFFDLTATYGSPTAGPLAIEQVELVARNVRMTAPFDVSFDAAVLSPQRNLHFAATVGPLPRDLQFTAPLSVLRRAELRLLPLQIEPLLAFLPATTGVAMSKALVDADFTLEMPADAGQLRLRGQAGARGLVFEDKDAGAPGAKPTPAADRRGQPADLRVQLDIAANLVSGDVRADKLELSLNDMAITGTADLRSLWTQPAVHALQLNSRGLLLEKLALLLPKSSLPPDLVARGPLLLRGSGSGTPTQAKVEVAVDLTEATLLLPVFHKPAQTPLRVELRSQLGGDGIDIERLGFVLGPLALLLKGKVKSGDDFDLKIDSGTVDLDQLLRLLPTVAKAVPKDSHIDGDLSVSGSVAKKAEALTAKANITMKGARLEAGDVDLLGGAKLEAQVRSTARSATVSADLDLGGAKLRVPGTVNKDYGVPMRLQLQAERAGDVVNVKLAELTLPGGTLRLNGRADTAKQQLDMKVPLCDLDLAKLAQVVPALSRGKLGGLFDSRLRLALSIDGSPQKLGTVRVRLDQFEMKAASGGLRGTGEVVGLDEPRKVAFDFSGDRLDLDALLGGSSDDSKPEPKSKSQTTVPRFLRSMQLDGKLHVTNSRYKSTQVQDMLLEVTMSGGKLVVKTLRATALGGAVLASGTTVDFAGAQPRFALRAKLDRIDLAQVMALKSADLSRKLEGHGTIDLSADGQGLSWEAVAPQLTGQLLLGLTDGRLRTTSLGAAVVGPVLAQLSSTVKSAVQSNELQLRDLAARFNIQGGQLRTVSPLRWNSEEGTLSMSGSIGLDKSLALTGNLDLSPKTIQTATLGKLVPDAPIPVGLRIGGNLSQPEIAMVDPGKTAAALLKALARGRGAELLKGAGLGNLGQVLGNPGAAGTQANPASPGSPASGSPGGGTPVVNPQQTQADLQRQQQEQQQRLQDEARRRLQEAGKRGLGGLFK